MRTLHTALCELRDIHRRVHIHTYTVTFIICKGKNQPTHGLLKAKYLSGDRRECWNLNKITQITFKRHEAFQFAQTQSLQRPCAWYGAAGVITSSYCFTASKSNWPHLLDSCRFQPARRWSYRENVCPVLVNTIFVSLTVAYDVVRTVRAQRTSGETGAARENVQLKEAESKDGQSPQQFSWL